MLDHLRIRDFAIIDELELEFTSGFTVVTGETGAGKSIIVDALGLVLGARANADVIRTGAESAEVEALFDVREQPLIRARLEQRELVGDDPSALVIRRIIGRKGRARVVINGCLATLATLNEIVRGLVDISGQHEQQSLIDPDNHLDMLDAFGDLDELRSGYETTFGEWRNIERERRSLQEGKEEGERQADFMRFQLQEIENLAPQPQELEQLHAEHARLAHAEKLQQGTALAEAWVYGEDGSAFDKLSKAVSQLETLVAHDESLVEHIEVLRAAQTTLHDTARALQHYHHDLEADPGRLREVEERIDALTRLCRKHGDSLEDVLVRADALRAELHHVDHFDDRLQELDALWQQAHAQVQKAADALTRARTKAAKAFSKQVRQELGDMELEEARFEVVVQQRKSDVTYASTGMDEVEFMWSANPGEALKPLSRIASGGELSRVMLAVKRVLCSRDLVSLYVFDEVDAGLGGRAAEAIGRKIRAVSHDRQAIAITHLAPIAAFADRHYCVNKTVQEGRTASDVRLVEGEARVEEITRMIGGGGESATRKAAKAMLQRSVA